MGRLRVVFVAALLLALLLPGAAGAYPWPFKPFDRQHPIRGFFGDPRTIYYNGILANPFGGTGVFSFHQGVDIAARNGTPIYAVADGTAHYLGSQTLNLITKGGVVFQYFHIVSVAGEDQVVQARKTVLGYVQPPFGHVHITEIDDGRAVNPLQRGHLTPFRDRTNPKIRAIEITNQTGLIQSPLGLCGRVQLDADAYDTPPVAVPGKFRGLPVAPSFVRWKLTRLGGHIVVPWQVAADFRHTVPPNGSFWTVYAHGTYENAPRFGKEQYSSMPGRFLFLLAASYDTTAIPNGVYTIVVQAVDERGNSTVAAQRISVLNAHGGQCPGSLPLPPGPPPPTEPPQR